MTRLTQLAVASPNGAPTAGATSADAMACCVASAGAVERLQVERTLRDERFRLACIIEATGAGTWESNVHTGEARFNAAWAAMLGYTLEQLEPFTVETWVGLVHPNDLAPTNAALAAHLASGTLYECEMRMRHRDGHWVWILTRGRVLSWTADGQPEWMFGTHTDLTARKAQESALRKSENFLHRIGDLAGVGGWELDLDASKLYWSPQLCRLLGAEPGYEPRYRPDFDETVSVYEMPGRAVVEAAIRSAIEEGEPWDLELPVVRLDGRRIWVRAIGHAECAEGRAVRLLGAFQDVTGQVEQRRLLRVTLESIGDAVLTTDATGRVSWLNPVAERLTGWPVAEAQGRPLSEVFHIVDEETREPAANPITACLTESRPAVPARPTQLISRQGETYGITESAAPIRDAAGTLLGVVLVFHDVTEQRRQTAQMSYRAKHDALTGLVNRAEFETRLLRTLQKTRDDGSEHALLFIDLDQFKLVNDACGHAVGDRLLQQMGRLLGEGLRSRDTLARLGGDEFAMLLEHCDIAGAQRLAQQICDRMDDFRFVHEDRRFRIGTSIGLVPVDRRWSQPAGAMQAADIACIAAKESGRNRVHTWFDTDLGMRARHGETQWAARLEQALDEHRFVLHAQRIETVADAVAGRPGSGGLRAEVLLRLVDTDGSLVAPAAFLPATERFHLSARIDRWVLKAASAWLAAQPDRAAIGLLHVNVSGQSVSDRAFHHHAIDILAEAGPAVCHRLCLEITETAAVTNPADAALFIDQVRALGVRIALDDFGAGASSFGYLKTLAVDILKIDGQFIQDLLDDPLDDVAVRCFVDVARVMGLETVAEFVDRPALLARLQEIGVDQAQGYLLHRPEPIGRLLELATASTTASATPSCTTAARSGVSGQCGLATPASTRRVAAAMSGDISRSSARCGT